MGERDSGHTSPDKEHAAIPPRLRPSIFSLKNIAILILGAVISSAFAIFIVGSYIAPTIEKRRADQQAATAKDGLNSELSQLSFSQIGPLIVNPAKSNGERYLKATISLETHDPELVKEIDKRMPQIKNQINNILSSRTIEQIQTNEDRERLRREIQTRVNGLLLTGHISNVYFEEFVYQ
jgi:flagellar basal body-associated protein FliL